MPKLGAIILTHINVSIKPHLSIFKSLSQFPELFSFQKVSNILIGDLTEENLFSLPFQPINLK